jgi:dTDP-4-amino-4,6-dideoxygalactose transaminase
MTQAEIPVFAPHIGLDTLRSVTAAFEAGWLGMGSLTREFEELIHTFLGAGERRVIATNTGTSALHIALLAAGVRRGDEVITPSFNYVADHQAIAMAGADVVFCDVRDDNLGVDIEKAEALVGPRTKAIIQLHFAGIPCDIEGVYQLANQRGVRVIEDATHAFGSAIGDRRIGSFGDLTCFSFDPVKVVTSIDGGCVVAGDGDEANAIELMRFLGVDKETTVRYQNRRAWDYDVVRSGFRYHLNSISASVGISQMERVGEFIVSRQQVCRQYSEAFQGIDGLRVPATDFEGVSPFIYSLRVTNGHRERLINHLRSRGIDVGIHFVPVHRHAQFASARAGDLSVTERIVTEVITLPLHSNMRADFVGRVIDGVRSYFAA